MRPSFKLRHLSLLTLPFALLLAGLFPMSSSAGTGLAVVFHNATNSDVKLVGTDNNCWYQQRLAADNAIEVNPGQTGKIDTETKDSGSCYAGSSWQNLEVIFKGPGGQYPNPYAGAVQAANASPYAANEGAWDLIFHNGDFNMRGTPKGPLPINPSQSGEQSSPSKGMFCLTVSKNLLTIIHLTIRPGTDCYGPAAKRIVPMKGVKAAKAGPGKVTGNAKIVYDLFQIGTAACQLTKPRQAWGYSGCDDFGSADAWDLHNVSTDVKDAKPSSDARVIGGWEEVNRQTFRNDSGAAGKQSWEYAYKLGDETSTETESGWKIGGKFEWAKKFTLPIIGQFEQKLEVSVDHEFGKKEEQKHSVEKEVKQASDIEAEAHHETTMIVKQNQATLLTTFSADLTAGTKGRAEPIFTPATRPLGFSAARRQPCIGMIAAKSPNSLMGLNAYARSQGITPETVGLPEEQRGFLEAAAALSGSDAAADRCPGYPDKHPAQFAFNGTAAYKGKAGGPTSADSFAPKLPGIATCVYSKPIDGPPHQAANTPVDPCKSGVEGPALAEQGTIIDADASGPGAVEGFSGGSLIQADDGPAGAPQGEELQVYQGLEGEDFLDGSQHGEELLGGGAQDVLQGFGGDDKLDGQGGDDTLRGGEGDDFLTDEQGSNAIFGEAGNDLLSSDKNASGGLFGGIGNDRLAMEGRGPVTLMGQTGNDIYRLDDARGKGVVEMPREGFDTVLTDSSMVVTPYVEKVRAVGNKGVSLTAGSGEQRLIGSKGGDVLSGGEGSDLLKGGAGRDRIKLQPNGIDLASGGKGADRFEVSANALGVGTRARKGLAVADKSAHVITDFKPAQGDKLVLSTRSFGKKLRGMKITRGNRARGKRAQLLIARRGLVSFDADGAGRGPARVVAVLKGRKSLPKSAVRVVKR